MGSYLLRVCLWCSAVVLGVLPVPRAVAQIPDDALALWAQATLYRDAWGTPHVYAETPRALGFAFGYAQAQDHIEAMLLAYRTANGRAAEVLGEKMAQSDEFALRLAHARLAEAAFPTLEPEVAELCTGFAMGVNTWLLEHEEQAPPWADGVKPSDPLALWHAFVCSMAPLDLPGVQRPPRAMETSNAWALAPERSEDGRTLLVINPHEYYNGTFRWGEAHLVLGDMNVSGATLFGLPLIVQGHNGVLGWGLTPNGADFADVFTEEIQSAPNNPKNPFGNVENALAEQTAMLEYLSQSQPYYVRTPAGLEERAAPGMVGPRGPLFESGGTLYSWTIGGYGEFGAFGQLLAMASAPGLEAFQTALARRQLPCFNIVYADRAGNILAFYNAKAGARNVPMEAPEDPSAPPPFIDWRQPVSSTLFQLAWGEGIEFEALPAVLNPAAGYVQATGGPPWAFTDDAPIGPALYPAWFIGETDTYRARRVRQLLRTGLRSFRDLQEMLYDTAAPAATEMVPLLIAMADNAGDQVHASHPDLATGMRLLKEWDFSADTSATGMTYYHVWWNLLTAKHAQDFVSPAALYAALLDGGPEAQRVALDAATDAARLMRNDLDALEVPWGEAHRVVRGEKDYAMPGATSGEPIFVSGDFEYGAGKWRASYGYGVAMAVAFGETPEAVSVAAFGSSEDPRSPHFVDQLDLLLAQRFKRALFLDSEVLRNATEGFGRRVMLYPLGAAGEVLFEAEVPVACRLRAQADAPAALPAGLAAFTVFVGASANPATLLGDLTVSLGVPVDLCEDDDLPQLALYQFTGGGGWTRVPDATTENDGRILAGRVPLDATFAVLGPESVLIKPSEALPLPPLEKTAKIPASAAPPETPAPTEVSTVAPPDKAVRSADGTMSLRLKGGYVPETAPPDTGVSDSARGTRVIRLRGADIEAAGGVIAAPDPKLNPEGKRGKMLWLEGLPPDLTFGPEAAPREAMPEAPTAEVDENGVPVLRMRGSGAQEPSQPQPNDVPQEMSEAPGAATPETPQQDHKLSRRERKRLEREAAEAAQQTPQVIEFGNGGAPQAGGPIQLEGPGDGFGDVPQENTKQKKKRRSRD